LAYAHLSTDSGHGLHPNFRGLGFLGDPGVLTPAQALQQAAQGETGSDFEPGGWIMAPNQPQVAQRRLMASAWSPNCATQPKPNMNLFTTAGGLALSTAATGTGIATATGALAAGTGAMLGAATMGAGLVVSVIGMIFAHHTAAVREEQALGCAAIAAANNALDVIDKAIAAGQTTPDAAASALDALVSNFSSNVGPMVQHNPCNANCELIVLLKAIVIYTKSIYANMSAQQSAAQAIADEAAKQNAAASQARAATLQQQANVAQASGDTATAKVLRTQAAELAPSSSSIPGWLWLVGAGLAAWAVL
jgi:hypothetical protein